MHLAFGFLGIERQLQDAATVPVHAALQVLQQATGMPEPADNHLRQRRTVRRQLEIKHPLRVARGFLSEALMTLQQTDLPAPCREAGRARASGQAAADHQGTALAAEHGRAGEPGFAAGGSWRFGRPAEELTPQDFPLVADAWRAFHLEPGTIEQAPHPAGAGKGADGRARGCQPRQFGE